MRIVRGKKVESGTVDLGVMAAGFKSVVVDIGTGDGRLVYKMAREQPDSLFIGVDSAADNMAEYSARALKKPLKGGASNVIYVAARAEDLPSELDGIAHKVFVVLPWGSLLEGVVKGRAEIIGGIARVARHPAALEMFFTYSFLHEEGEMGRRELPDLSLEYIDSVMAPAYRDCGILLEERSIISNDEIRRYETQWARKLGFGRARAVFRVIGRIG